MTDEVVRLFGSGILPPAPRVLKAGALSLEIDGASVRYIRFAGIEAIRAVDYLVRDANWATPVAQLSEPAVEESRSGFKVTFEGHVKNGDIDYRYQQKITGTAEGRLEIEVLAKAFSSFATNRTGFTVLHPAEAVVGAPVQILHGDGSLEEGEFPALISPGQPIFSIRSLRHEVSPGLFATCHMQASLPYDPDAIFEMEDQRNWTDASYKTYVGSLLDPWPYTIKAGDTIDQKITITFEGHADRGGDAGSDRSVSVASVAEGHIPRIGLGMMPEDIGAVQQGLETLATVKAGYLSAYIESDDPALADRLAAYAEIAKRFLAEIQLEVILSEAEPPASALANVAELCRQAGLSPQAVLATPRPYLKSVQPSGPWPLAPDLAHVLNQARLAFPEAVILGGMASYFTEFNRKRPPAACFDAVSCTTSPLVHAGDDRSVMETLETLPMVIASMKAIGNAVPVHLGPSAIAMRHNPYGADTIDNPDGLRIAMARQDPRQKGLFAAAWAVGYAANSAKAGVEQLVLNHLAGASGLLDEAGRPYPVFHAMCALVDAATKPALPVVVPAGIAALAFQFGDEVRLIMANLKPVSVDVDIAGKWQGLLLDSETMAEADADWLASAPRQELGPTLELKPHGVVFAWSCPGG